MVGTVLTTKTMMKTQTMVVCVHWKTPLKSVMIFTLCGATAIPRTIPTTPRSKILGFFLFFPFKKHLTSAPGCGIIIVGRAGPGRRPGTEFPIGTPHMQIFWWKVRPFHMPQISRKTQPADRFSFARSVRTYGHTVAQKLVLICRVSKSKRLSICLSRVCNHARKFDF